jgi:adenylate cyclase
VFKKFRKKLPIIGVGLCFLLVAAWLQLSSISSIAGFRSDLDLNAYDLLLNIWISDYPKSSKNPVMLVDIDEKSIQKIGRWPWPRNIVAKLVNEVRKAGATVIAFDITFTQPEKNIAKVLLEDAQKNSPSNRTAIQFLENSVPQYDYDKDLAMSLAKGDSILGIAFNNDTALNNVGQLPPPLMTLDKNSTESSLIYTMLRYRANLPNLQESAKHGGFLTIFPDDDGLLRRVPLVLRYGNDIYPSLALETVRQYLLLDKVGIETENIGDAQAVAGIRLGDNRIPTDQYGQVFIPFYKKIRSRQTISALDVLNGQLHPDQLKNAIIVIGSSAPSLNDLHPTPVDSLYPGPYIHLEVIRALLANDFSYRPGWAPAFELLALIIIGIICAFLFPFLEAIGLILMTIAFMLW